jgi:hypothetical protein
LEEMIRKRESNVLKEKGEPIKLYSDWNKNMKQQIIHSNQ